MSDTRFEYLIRCLLDNVTIKREWSTIGRLAAKLN